MNSNIPQDPVALSELVLIDQNSAPSSTDDFFELDDILDDLRTRDDETPQWEFCEGFMAALICCRRPIPASEYLPVLLGFGGPAGAHDAAARAAAVHEDADGGSFANDAQAQRFMTLWVRRWNEVADALNLKIEDLNDDNAYQPAVMDIRAALAELPEAERATLAGQAIPSFAQVWALGFMFAVETWADEWAAPRDKKAAQWLDAALESIVALTDDDTDEPTEPAFEDDGPLTVSTQRLDAFADAIWAVYDLRELMGSLGPRVETVRAVPTPGRNDPCSCGSGKKFKKCCGA